MYFQKTPDPPPSILMVPPNQFRLVSRLDFVVPTEYMTPIIQA